MALHEKYLKPYLTMQSQYKVLLMKQARVAPIPAMKCIPIHLFVGETGNEDNTSIRWPHKARALSSSMAFRASVSVADIRLERPRGQLLWTRSRYAPVYERPRPL